MSDTPLTDEAYFKPGATMYSIAGEMKLLERENEKLREELELYKRETIRTVEACEFMREDKSLGLTVGDRLSVDGVKALRKSRDQWRELAGDMLKEIKEWWSHEGIEYDETRSIITKYHKLKGYK
jgi:predicted DNA binding CopG/RHH family protein